MSQDKKNTAFRLTLTGFLITLAGAVFFSTKAIFVKLAFRANGVDAITLLSLRMLLSLPFYIVAAWIGAKKESSASLSKKEWMYVFVLGVFGYHLSSLFDFIGLQYISAGLERLILFLYPTFAVLINTWLFKSKLNRTQFFALILTYLGIGIAYIGELKIDTSNPNFYFGSFMIFLCAITYSFYLVGTGKMIPKIGVTRYTAYAMLSATFGIFLQFLVSRNISSIPISSGLIWYSVALALIATVLPSFLLSNGMKRIGSNNVSIITSIGPVSTIIQAHFILGEKMMPEQIIGTLFVIAGVLLIGWQSRSSHQ